jgi:hypothetical protein
VVVGAGSAEYKTAGAFSRAQAGLG